MRGRVRAVIVLEESSDHHLAGKAIDVVETDNVPIAGDEWVLPGDSKADGPVVLVLKRQWMEHGSKVWVTVSLLEAFADLYEASRDEIDAS